MQPARRYFAAMMHIALKLFVVAIVAASYCSRAGATATTQPVWLDDDDANEKLPTTSGESSRYFLGLLDNRSSYGNDFFHDSFLGPEFDSERQLELDYSHGENDGSRDDEIDAGVQWNVIGQLSAVAEFGWDSESETTNTGGDGDDAGEHTSSGFENVDLAVYHPIFQFVSKDNFLDYTAVARLDLGIPTRTPQSGTDVQLTPYLGQLLRLGNHVSIEAWVGPQFTIAPDQTTELIYGASFGYVIPHSCFPIPLLSKFRPIFELDGQTGLSSDGDKALFGIVGFDAEIAVPGGAQPQIEIGYQFPIDSGAGAQLRWGILAQVFLEF
jgi:hypothetical protein